VNAVTENYTVVRPDIDIDTDRDGNIVISGANEQPDDEMEWEKGICAHVGAAIELRTPLVVRITPFDQTIGGTITLEKSGSGKVRVRDTYGWQHLGENDTSADLTAYLFAIENYNLRIEGVEAGEVELKLTYTNGGFITYDRVRLFLGPDVDIDSDNDNGYDPPDQDDAEDLREDIAGYPQYPGKITVVNDGDIDADGIPDFADGYNRDATPANDDDTCTGLQFVPVVLQISKPEKASIESATITITYNSSNPANVTEVGGVYTITDAGILRLWKNDGPNREKNAANAVQDPGDFIPGCGGEVYTAAQLGFTQYSLTQTFFVEAVRPSSTVADQQIKVEFDWDGEGVQWPTTEDAVRVTVVRIDISTDSDNDGTISSNDDMIEDMPPGCIIPKDMEGDGAGQDFLKPISLDAAPLVSGASIVLTAEAGVNIWTTIAKTSQVTLPATYTPASLPSTLYVDGITAGSQPKIGLTYKSSNGVVLHEDNVKVLITETISWAPQRDDIALVWSSLPSLGENDGMEFQNQLKDQGFVVTWYRDATGDADDMFGDCTLENYKKMPESGAFHVISHGGQGAHYVAYATDTAAGRLACDAWRFPSTLAGDDVITGGTIDTGADGICNTAAVAPDVQVIPVGQGSPNGTAITPGPNGLLDTAAGGDDQVDALTITTGANGKCETVAGGDDVQSISLNQGEPNQICINGGETGITTERWPGTCYALRVSSSWLANRFAPETDTNRTITEWAICYSAQGNSSTGETAVKEAAGGRWRIGYWNPTFETEAQAVAEIFFERLNGTRDSSLRRTAGAAWDSGIGYSTNARMDGNAWTTLCPAPMADKPVFPNVSPGPRPGWGCIVFDTYMNVGVPASDAIIRVSGDPISDEAWAGGSSNKFLLGFYYGGNVTTVRALADKCRNADSYGGRKMDGNRVTPNGDNKDWSW